MDLQADNLDAFQVIVSRGHCHIARMIYSLITTKIEVNCDTMFGNMMRLLTIHDIPRILQRYGDTLEFLHEVNINITGNPLIKLISQLSLESYNKYGKDPLFLKIIETLINMGYDINEPRIVENCITTSHYGGFKLLEDFGVLNATCTDLFVANLDPRTLNYVNYIKTFTKYATLSPDQMNQLFHRLIRRVGYCVGSTIDQFLIFATENGYPLILTDRGFKSILRMQQIPSLERIFKNVTQINIKKEYTVKTQKLYDLLTKMNINAILHDNTEDVDHTSTDSEEFAEVMVDEYFKGILGPKKQRDITS